MIALCGILDEQGFEARRLLDEILMYKYRVSQYIKKTTELCILRGKKAAT